VPSLKDLATNLANYNYYSGVGTFDANRLPFGRDRAGDGDSNQPFVVRKIDQRWSPSNFNDTLTPFGAVTTVTRTIADVVRVSKFLYTTIQGPLFLLKQTGLQRMNPNIRQIDASPAGGKGTIRTQTYNPLGINTIAQVGLAGAGLHLLKHGILPGFSGERDNYERFIHLADAKGENRLNSLSVYLSNNIDDSGRYDYRSYILKYSGGPKSFYGIGNTTLNRYSYFLTTKYIDGERADSNNGFIYIPHAQYQSLTDRNTIQINLNKGTQDDNVFTFGQNKDFREYKNKLNKEQFANKYTTLASSDYTTKNIERRVGVARVRSADQRVNYTSSADTADRINAVSLYYSSAPPLETQDINDNNVNAANIRDLIKFRIKSLDNDNSKYGVYMIFRAYLSNIRRTVNSKWDAYKYVGRGESFYAYDGFTETITFSFVIAASSRAEMKPLYQKLNYLISTLTPDYREAKSRGNIAELTIGDFVLYQPGIITSFDMNIDEDSNWEIAYLEPDSGVTGADTDMHELPQLIKCNMTFIPIYNFLPRKSSEAPFIGIDGMSEPDKINKQWLKGTNTKLSEFRTTKKEEV